MSGGDVFAVLVLIALVIFGVKGCHDISVLSEFEKKVKSQAPFTLEHEYQCNLTEKGKKQQALEKELRELK